MKDKYDVGCASFLGTSNTLPEACPAGKLPTLQRQQLEQRLAIWRAEHPDVESRRKAYRQQVPTFTLNSMALEGNAVDRERLLVLLNQRAGFVED
jgi:hypothetical protein